MWADLCSARLAELLGDGMPNGTCLIGLGGAHSRQSPCRGLARAAQQYDTPHSTHSALLSQLQQLLMMTVMLGSTFWSLALHTARILCSRVAVSRKEQPRPNAELGLAGKRVFVPGCGRGYDLVALLAAGAEEAVGLELAPTAVSHRQTCICQRAGCGHTGLTVVSQCETCTCHWAGCGHTVLTPVSQCETCTCRWAGFAKTGLGKGC